ncbi:MAG: UDP-N-acetylmuramoyl-tripeptide--D-alanyl-D-alanine ligase [Candidatus Margulisiibacteriota bacterium]
MLLSLSEVLRATGGTTAKTKKNILFKGISTDSRTTKQGDLFVPLKGPNFDGHNFIAAAFKKGAIGALSSKKLKSLPKGKIVILLPPDTHKDRKFYPALYALLALAKLYRSKFPVKTVAVTGSSGKTTTKDMIYSVLLQQGLSLKTEENLNNEIGVPLTVFNLSKKHRFAVIEMGMQGKGEIKPLSVLCAPDIATITNIGEAHLARLKTKRSIAKAKSEIICGVKPKGAVILNADDIFFPFLKRISKGKKVISFGINGSPTHKAFDIRESNKGTEFGLRIAGKTHRFFVPLPGRHNVYNALTAVAVGLYFKIPPAKIQKGLKSFKPSSKRMDIIRTKGGVKVINDTYNANPSSMAAALKTLALGNGRKIAVLGDMLELGPGSKEYHKKIGRLTKDLGIDLLVAVGKKAKYFLDNSCREHCFYFREKEKAVKFLLKILRPGDTVLIKASRGIKLEEITQKILDSHS